MGSVRPGRPTGRAFVGGLPSSPRARSVGRNDVRERETERYKERTRESDYYPYRSPPSPAPSAGRRAPAHSVRSHRSMTNLTSRGGPSSSRTVPDVPPLPLPRYSNESYNSSASGGSYSSMSGSSSSFLDRMKGRGGYGYGSSRTSFEEEPEQRSRDWKEVRDERGGWLRQRTAAMPEREYGSGETINGDDSSPGGQSGYGLWLWSRVATAASTLTISVSKAWASNIAAHPGERTPPGEESRLTRALKAYHIDKARDPTDLPEWLFDEHERRPIGRSGTSFRYREDSEYGERETRRVTVSTQPRAGGGRGLRDVYDAAGAATRQQESLRESPSRRRLLPQRDDVAVGGPAPTSKAHDRLKALRDAKRQAALRNTSVSSIDLSTSSRSSLSDGLAAREERGRSLVQDRRQGDGPHRRAPSLPASVRPPHKNGLPPRPGIRMI